MQQELQVQLTQTLREDLSNPILRYYLQEDAFNATPHSQDLFELPFNQIAAEVVAEVTLSNKQITSNSRLAANLLENGKEIFRNKKLEYFTAFLKEYEYIKSGLDGLSREERSVFEYSVMAISNLILKLSLNMSRISVVILSRQQMVRMLNPFITALLFQKFLQKEHLRSKEASRKPQEHPHLLKQFPKITLIRISHTRNPFDRFYINKCQQLFASDAHNVQLVEIYEKEGDRASLIMTESSQQSTQKGESYNVHELLGLTAPFGMEFYLFFSQVIVPKVQGYKPDIVIYYEDMPCGLGVEPGVKGLILNVISEKVQNKIYVFKQFGITTASHFFSSLELPPDPPSKVYKSKFELDTHQNEDLLRMSQSQRHCTVREMQIRESTLQAAITKAIVVFRNNKIKTRLFKLPEGKPSELEVALKKMRGELFEELSYISLALLQRENFQSTNACFRNYTFPTDFLKRFIAWANAKLEEVSKTKAFSDEIIGLQKKIYMLEGMLEMSAFEDDETNKSETDISENAFYFYNFNAKRVEKLTQYHHNQVATISVSKYDQIYLHYSKTHLLVFLVTQNSLKVYAKQHKDMYLKCLRQDRYQHEPRLGAKNSTLVANTRVFYKAFGQLEGKLAANSYVCSLRIDNIEDIAKFQANKWNFYDQCTQGTGRLKLQLKILGWGWAEEGDSNLVILGGGYNFAAQNEQKVNKFLYVISSKGQICKVGKLNSELLNLAQNIKSKNVVIPCVYGVPLAFNGRELVLLNSNGYCQKLNHLKKMFLTRVRVDNQAKSRVCVVAQNKMQYGKPEEDIANKNTILNYMIAHYNQINRCQGSTSYCDAQGNVLVLQLEEQKAADCVRVECVGRERGDMCEENRSYQIGFGRSRLVLNGQIRPDFIKKNR